MNSVNDSECRRTSDKDAETVFPWSLAEEVFDLLLEQKISIVRYCDLDILNSWCGSRLRYFDEYIKFRTGRKNPVAFLKGFFFYAVLRWGGVPRLRDFVRKKSRKMQPPTLFLEHDADLMPDKTLEMMRREQRKGIRSSCYFFVKHAQEENYCLDVHAIQAMEKHGFEIGYHQNAFERSGYVEEEALKLVADDLAWLNKHFDIRSFVPHGGLPGEDGRNNEYLPHKGKLKPLLWAYNGKCILKDYTWSDGGIKKRSPYDPRKFVRNLVRGSRAMMLMHPQYYGDKLRKDWEQLPIASEKWWRGLWEL